MAGPKKDNGSRVAEHGSQSYRLPGLEIDVTL
jgi:hypothetical protein